MLVVQFIVSKGAKSRNRYNQVPHLTQDNDGKVTNSQLDTTNESREVSPPPLVQERFKSNLEFRNQVIVSSIKFRKGFAKFMIPLALFKKFLS